MDNKVVGILGGGQLGRMIAEAANRLNVTIAILDSSDNPATQINSTGPHVSGSFKDPIQIQSLATRCDVITVEIEHVDTHALEAIESTAAAKVHPSPQTIRTIQDKYAQKVHLVKYGVPVPDFKEVVGSDAKTIANSIRKIAVDDGFGYPLMLKCKMLAYDGKGNRVIKSDKDVDVAVSEFGKDSSGKFVGLYIERWVPFDRELAVMVVRGMDGEVVSYPCVETVQKDNVCHIVVVPAQIDGIVCKKAMEVAKSAISSFEGAGIYGVEMFQLKNGDILLNEIAPRPHNSGHYTIEACHTSQFENHLRAVLGMPLGSPDLKVPASAMINLLGSGNGDAGMESLLKPCKIAMTVPGATVHLYGKRECRVGRKMGHITIVGNSMPEVRERVNEILAGMDAGSSESVSKSLSPRPVVGIIMGSDSDLPTLKP
ncbi:hypothetical protein HDU76_010132, partial [Blyttiomyces sp. JEL0837]